MAKMIEVDNSMEHRILVGAITSDQFLARAAPMVAGCRYAEELFRSRAVGRVFRWCRDYHGKYGKAPGRSIQDIHEAEASKRGGEPEQAEQVAELLSSLSEQFEQEEAVNNPDHLLDEAERYLRERMIDLVREDLGNYRSAGQLDKAEELVAQFRRPARPATEGINPLTDADTVREAFEQAPESVLPLPGILGSFLSQHLVREGFVAFMGPEKRGKTFCLTELALRALQARRNVALLATGDMSLRQMVRRIHIRLAGRSDWPAYCRPHHAPVMDCVLNQDGSCRLPCRESGEDLGKALHENDWSGKSACDLLAEAPEGYRPCTACRRSENSEWQGAVWWQEQPAMEPLTWRDGMKEAEAMQRRARGRSIKLAAFPNNTVSVPDLDRQLDMWERYENFIPDVVVIDYADILAAVDGKKDYRHQQNETWMALRRMSEERRCLVLTATQTDTASYSIRTLTMDNFSEDKRKYGHVTAMFGLNQTLDERQLGVLRLNTVLVREGESDPRRCVHLLQDLRRGRFWTDHF